MAVAYISGSLVQFLLFLVCCAKKNLATLEVRRLVLPSEKSYFGKNGSARFPMRK
jgi:hypothetical protein